MAKLIFSVSATGLATNPHVTLPKVQVAVAKALREAGIQISTGQVRVEAALT